MKFKYIRDKVSEFLWGLSCRVDDLGNFIALDYEIPYQHFAYGRTLAERKDWTLPACRVNLERTLTTREIGAENWARYIRVQIEYGEKESFTNARERDRVEAENRFSDEEKTCGDPYGGWYPQR